MSEVETNAITQVAIEIGIDTAGVPGIGTVVKELYRRSSQGKIDAELAKINLEEEVTANLTHLVHGEVQTYLDDMIQGDRAEQVSNAYNEANSGEKPTPPDLVKIARSLVEKAEASIDTKKRRLLAAAVMNSFDPVLYQLGMTEDLLRILDDLTYSDAVLLKQFGSESPPTYKSIQAGASDAPGLEAVNKLVRLYLVDDAWQRDPSHQRQEYTLTGRGHALLRLLSEERM